MTRGRAIGRGAGAAAIIAGLALLGYAGTIIFRARAHQRTFEAGPAAPIAVGTPVTPTPPPKPEPLVEGATIGEIRIDRIGVRTVITQGETDAILDLGAGHLADTPWLGQPGNVVLAGHRDTVFRPLEKIHVGDVIEVTGHSTVMRYAVSSTTIVDPSDVSVLEPSNGNTLTLITCYPFVYVGHAPRRFIVRANQIQ